MRVLSSVSATVRRRAMDRADRSVAGNRSACGPGPAARLAAVALTALAMTGQSTEIEVLYQGRGLDAWDTGRDAGRLAREFVQSSLGPAPGPPPALLWRFVPRNVRFNDIFLRRPVRRDFTVVRLRVRNAGRPLTLALKVGDAKSAEWTANRVRLGPESGWTWIEFPRKAWRVAPWSNDPDGVLNFPLRYLTVIAFDVKPGEEYSLLISRLEIERPDPARAEVRAVHLPREARAGQKVSGTIEFRLDRPCRGGEAALAFALGTGERFRLPLEVPAPLEALPAREWTAARLRNGRVPVFAPGGTYTVILRLGDARVQLAGRMLGDDEGVTDMTIQPRTPGKLSARVKPWHGVPTLFLNGRPHPGMAYAAYRPGVKVFREFAEAGVDLFSFSATPTEAGYGLSKTAWLAPDKFDFSQLDRRALMVLEADPEAFFFPRLYLHAPTWWSEKHPDDIVLYDPGDGKPVPFIHSGGKPAPSWASDAWRRDTAEGLRRLIAHVRASPYSDRVIGYHLASGTTEEWMMWGANENQWVDYSPVNTARFRKWLRRKYRTVKRLRRAWDDPAVAFETAAVPAKARRSAAGLGALRLLPREQPVVDYYLYNSELVADTIAYFARVVKKAAGDDRIVGVFYGYLLQLCGEQRQQNAGHLALDKVLNCPDVDFLCSPTSYAFRQPGGEGTSHFMSLLGSVKLHGKLWFDENDIRTSLSPGAAGGWGKPADLAGDILQQDKELANVLANGAAQWWFDVGGNRYDAPELMRRLAGYVRNARTVLDLDRSPVDQVAFVVDEDSLTHLRVADPLGRWLLVGQVPALRRLGAPVGDYLAADLERIGNRRLFIFPTSLAPSPAQRRAVDALKCDGRVLVFLYLPGVYRNGRIETDAMESFTGIQLGLLRTPRELRVTIRETDDPLVAGLAGQTYGPKHKTLPVGFADDPAAVVLGSLPDGRPGLVVRRYPDWTAVYSAVPLLPVALLRNLARAAGVHTYIDTPDVVWAGRDLVAVSVRDAGPRTVRLPRTCDVRDLYTGRTLAAGVREFRAEFAEKSTRVFILTDGNK